MIDERFISESINYYQDKIRKFGSSAEGMDWKNRDTQYLRFEIISRYIDFSIKPSILDVGCGNGEFNNFCIEGSRSVSYSGIDVVDEMVEFTNNRFEKNTAVKAEFLKWESQESFDYIIASGTFNAKLNADESSWQEYFFENIRKMHALSNKGIIFNCMSSFVDFRYDRLYYPSSAELSEFAVKNLSRHFIIDHSYPLYEQTMFISKI